MGVRRTRERGRGKRDGRQSGSRLAMAGHDPLADIAVSIKSYRKKGFNEAVHEIHARDLRLSNPFWIGALQ